jgi:hypothetical protein
MAAFDPSASEVGSGFVADAKAPTVQSGQMSLHCVLDTMNEAQTRNRKDNAPENLSFLRRIAINLARLEPSKGNEVSSNARIG